MRVSSWIPALALLAALPGAARAQGGSCDIIRGQMASSTEVAPGQRVVSLAGPVHLQCTGGVTIRADQATNYEWRRELLLTGNVFFEDPEKRITADWVQRFGDEGRLVARGNVVVVDKASGSVVRGTDLVHHQERGALPARTVVTGRPHATLPPRGAAAGDTLEIDADRMELLGEDVFHGYGDVAFVRGAYRGSSRDATFDQAAERVRLMGAARLWGEDFELLGDTVTAALVDQKLRQVDALVAARLQTDELDVASPELRIYLTEGELERLVAVTREGGEQAVATTQDFRLVADSIEALAPGERLERVLAAGSAYGERLADSVDLDLPELVRNDWLRGDTIIGRFAAVEPGAEPPEGRAAQAVLEELVAIGGGQPAQSLFRMAERERARPAGPEAINYFVARRITVAFVEGEVADVKAQEEIRGVHLQPTRRTGTDAGVQPADSPERRR